MDEKLKGEDALRASGTPYTIVRPGGLTNQPGGKAKLTWSALSCFGGPHCDVLCSCSRLCQCIGASDKRVTTPCVARVLVAPRLCMMLHTYIGCCFGKRYDCSVQFRPR